MVVNIDQDQYSHHMGQAAGVRVVIHSQNNMPFPEDEGLLTRTGYNSQISIEKVKFLHFSELEI